MNIQFATCDRDRAIEFLRKLYPSCKVEDVGATKVFLDLVEADVMRVQDPDMHENANVMPGTKWSEAERASNYAVCHEMHTELMGRPS